MGQLYAPMPVPAGTVIPANRTVDSAGNSYSFTEFSLLKTTSAGVTTTIASATNPNPSAPFGSDSYVFNSVTVDSADNVYAVETRSISPQLIAKVTSSGLVSRINVGATPMFIDRHGPHTRPITTDQNGNIFVGGVDGAIYQLKPDGTQTTVAPSFWFHFGPFLNPPEGLAADTEGNLYTSVRGVTNHASHLGPLKLVRLTSEVVITRQPEDATILLGANHTLSVTAASLGMLTCQWYRDGQPLTAGSFLMYSSGANSVVSTFSITLPGTYTAVVRSVTSSVTSAAAVVSTITTGGAPVAALPTITVQPQNLAFAYGRNGAQLSVSAASTLPVSYQWQLNGTNLSGANAATYTAKVPGSYTVVATTSAGSVTSAPAEVTLGNRTAAISARTAVGAGDNVSIAGFVVSSFSGAPKRVLIRAVGPGLASKGVPGFLTRPALSLFDATGRLMTGNTGWSDSPDIIAATAAAGTFPLSAGSADSALIVELPPGAYTAQVSGVGATTGIALVEIYETGADAGHFTGLSARAPVGTGDNILIGGFVVAGTQAAQVLICGIGPGLKQRGVPGTLEQPVLSVYNASGQLVAINVGWSTNPDAVKIAAAISATGHPALEPGSADCAVLLTLPPGNYTAQVAGVNSSTGNALLEAYPVPQ